MRILISAYSCDPYAGSEPFLGWRWSCEIAKHHTVCVITRTKNRPNIEKFIRETGISDNLSFEFVDCGKILKKIKKTIPQGLQIYYYFWQKLAVRKAKELHNKRHFDIVHHISFGAYTQPTFMQELGIPFVWGPLGGGERLPHIAGRKIDFSSQLYETTRNWQMDVYNHFSFTKAALKGASRILVTTDETFSLVPEVYRDKTIVFQSLGIDEDFMSKDVTPKRTDGRIKVLVVGRMIAWKGFDIAIDSFRKLIENRDDIDLYLRGGGRLKQALKERCGDLLDKRIFFVDTFFNYEDMFGFYKGHDIFLNCTLHDSGCLALLEAMSAGLPCVVIDTGGPHVISEDSNAIKIQPQPLQSLTASIADAITKLADNKNRRVKMGKRSREIIDSQYMYNIKYEVIEQIYRQITQNQN